MEYVLEIKNLNIDFITSLGINRAVNNFNGKFKRNKITAIIGETGSGKSVLGSAIMGLLASNGTVSGEILYENSIDLLKLDEKGFNKLRGTEIAWIAQDPFSALNSVWKIDELISESSIYHRLLARKEKKNFAKSLLKKLRLNTDISSKYIFELSGGMAQRVLIASGVGIKPKLLIMDEPTKGLDEKNVIRVEELINKLKDEEVSIILITHDLELASNVADDVIVMYNAMVLEKADAKEFFINPKHKYSKALIKSMPKNGMEAINRNNIGV